MHDLVDIDVEDIINKLTPEDKLRAAVLASKKLSNQERVLSMDPHRPGSRPTAMQQEIIDEVMFGLTQILAVRSGNQCLIKGTQVLTPNGAVAIESIKVGDVVFSEDGTPINVLKTFSNGKKTVGTLTSRNTVWAISTAEHRWLKAKFSRTTGELIEKYEEVSNSNESETSVVRTYVKTNMGSETPFAPYTLGVLLGDGCSREYRLSLSSATDKIPTKVAQELNCNFQKNSEFNYTYNFDSKIAPDYYSEWCKGRYAHEKIVDLDIIKQWDRASLVKFIAGVFDSDGSLSGNEKAHTIIWTIGMQAKSVLDALAWGILSLWQIPVCFHVDNRAKYKNGPVHYITIKNPHDIKRMMEELQPHILSEQKHWNTIYDSYGKRTRDGFVKLNWTELEEQVETYDIHVDSPTNLYLLANGLVTHNSGKTVTGCYCLARTFAEDYPGWKRPVQWGTQPSVILLVSQTNKQIEGSLYPKIVAFLEPGSFREHRQSGSLQSIEHKKNGNKIIFFSYENPAQAAARVQSFTGMLAMIDELPPSIRLIEELQRSVIVNEGKLLLTFTPKVVNVPVRKFVDGLNEPTGKTYRLSFLDNPVLTKEAKANRIATLKLAGPEALASALYGDWASGGDEYVFSITKDTIRKPLNYSLNWRHVESSDPAVASKHGVVIAAEDPTTGHWYIVREALLQGFQHPQEYPEAVLRMTRDMNIVRRIYDPAATTYMMLAKAIGMHYMAPYNKNNRERRLEMIQKMKEVLGVSVFIDPSCEELINQLSTMMWSPTREGYVKDSDKWHLCDSLRYLIDLLPSKEAFVYKPKDVWDFLDYHTKQADKKEKQEGQTSFHHKGDPKQPIYKKKRRWI